MASAENLPTDAGGEHLEGQLRGAAAGTGIILAGFVIYALLNVVFQLVIARVLGPQDVGRYFQATAVVGILLGLCTGGLTVGLVRLVTILARDEALALARGIVLIDVASAAGLAVALWAASAPLADHVFHDSAIAP